MNFFNIFKSENLKNKQFNLKIIKIQINLFKLRRIFYISTIKLIIINFI